MYKYSYRALTNDEFNKIEIKRVKNLKNLGLIIRSNLETYKFITKKDINNIKFLQMSNN